MAIFKCNSPVPVLEGRLFEAATARAALAAAWKRVRANRGAPGGDRQVIADFARRAERHLDALHGGLREGNYRPGPVRRVAIPKPDGGTRTLAIPCVADRIVQTAVASLLARRCDGWMHPHSFAYRPGRSVDQALATLVGLRDQGFRHIVDGDIRRFFDSVPQRRLIRLLKRRVKDAHLIGLILGWLPDFAAGGGWLRGRHGIAQGSPLSPFLANLYLDAFDWATDGPGCRLVRYADDFVLACWTRSQAQAAVRLAADSLRELGLELHPTKTQVTDFAAGFEFLGCRFAGNRVTRDQRPPETAQC